MFAKRLIPGLLLLLGSAWAAFAQETITIALDDTPRFRAAATATLSGTVTPVDASLSLDGAALALDGNGRFSHDVTLTEGLNTFFLIATVDGLPEARLKRDLFRDTVAPVLAISEPLPDLRTNRTSLHIIGEAGDALSKPVSLTRDGQPVTVLGGRFYDRDVPLQPGANTFHYTLTDAAGNTAERSLTVHHKTEPPTIDLTAPGSVDARGSFDIAVSFEPASEIVSVRVYLNADLVREASDGSALQQTFQDDGSRVGHQLRIEVRDVYGNQAQLERDLPVAHPNFVHGLVLDSETSHPLAGVTVQLASPAAATTAVTDAAGRYVAYLAGSPITARVTDPTYVPIARTLDVPPAGGARLFDLRLTRRGPPQSTAQVFDDPFLRLQFVSGFSGTACVTPLRTQALPVLLPLGYAPLRAFELADATGSGPIQAQLRRPPRELPPATEVLLLRQDGDGWRVSERLIAGGTRIDATWPAAGNGVYAAVLRDTRFVPEAPAVGSLLIREGHAWIPGADTADAVAFPKMVSLLDTPRTELRFLAHGHQPSGAFARLRAREHHTTFDGQHLFPDYLLDVACYHYGDQLDGRAKLVGHLPIVARGEISRGHTRAASIKFYLEGGSPPLGGFRYDAVHDLGPLQLDFGPQPADPRAVRTRLADMSDVPMPAGAERLASFTLTVGRELETSPSIRFQHGDREALVLLRRQDAQTWVYAGRLRFVDGAWQAAPEDVDATVSGAYALVALPFPITELRGQVTFAADPVAEVTLQTEVHPWRATSAADGGFRFAVARWNQPQNVDAYDPATTRSAQLHLADTSADDLRDGLDLALQAPDFRLVDHRPAANQVHVSRHEIPSLTFSHALGGSVDDWTQAITLQGGGTTVPLRIQRQADYRTLTLNPQAPLADDTEYTVTVGTGLLSQHGHPLVSAASFSYRTADRSAVGTLDLKKFYLTASGDDLVVHAPADTYPARSRIRLINRHTAATVTDTMLGGDYQRGIAGHIGDRIQVAVTRPDGQTASIELDSVRTGPGQVILGGQPFVLDLGDGSTLHVERVLGGVGREVRFALADEAEVRAELAKVPRHGDDPFGTFYGGLRITPLDGGPVPRLAGRFQRDLDPATIGTAMLSFVALQPEAPFPANPLEPETLTPHTFATLADAVAVRDGQLGSTTKRTRTKRFGGRIAASLGQAYAHLYGLFHTDSTSFIFGQSLREDVRNDVESTYGNLMWVEPPPSWYNPSLYTRGTTPFYPCQNVYFYQRFGDGENAFFKPLGLTGPLADGDFLAEPDPGQPTILAMDPVTHRLTLLELRPSSASYLLAGSHAYRATAWLRWPKQGGAGNDAELELDWRVVTLDGDEPVVHAGLTETFRQTGKLLLDPGQTEGKTPQIQVTIKADQPLKHAVAKIPEVDWNETVTRDTRHDAITVLLPATAYGTERKLDVALTVVDGFDQSQDVYKRVWLVRPDQAAGIPNVAPAVLASTPQDKGTDVLIADPLYLEFSEPVRNVGPATVTLTPDGGDPVTLAFSDANGLPVEAATEVRLLTVQPTEALKLDTRYTFDVRGVRDQENRTLLQPADTTASGTEPAKDHYRIQFRTQTSRPQTVVPEAGDLRAYAGLRNLLVGLDGITNPDGIASGFKLRVYDTDTRHAEPRLLTEYREAIRAPGMLAPKLVLITKEALAAVPGAEVFAIERDNRERLRALPAGTLLVVQYYSFAQHSYVLMFLHYDGATFEEKGHFRVPTTGTQGGFAAIGPYLILGDFDLTEAGPVGTATVHDVRQYLERLANVDPTTLQDSLGGGRHFHAWQQTKPVGHYANPRGVVRLAPFLHQTEGGLVPAFAAAAFGFPGLNAIVPQASDLLPPDHPPYDRRALAKTVWPHRAGTEAAPGEPGRFGVSRLRCAVVEAFPTQSALGETLTRDIAIFGERGLDQDGSLYIYEVPEKTDLDQATPPRFTLHLPGGFLGLASDRAHGLVAVRTRIGNEEVGVGVLDLRALYARGRAQGVSQWTLDQTFAEEMFLTWIDGDADQAPVGRQLFMHDGALYWSLSDERLRRLPLASNPYRTFGWLTYDLARWQAGTARHDTSGRIRDPQGMLTHQPYGVLYATDLDVEGEVPAGGTGEAQTDLAFTVEMGTFEVEVFAQESLKLVYRLEGEFGAAEVVHEVKDAKARTLVGFDTRKLNVAIQNQAKALREHGFLKGEVALTLTRQGTTVMQRTLPFLVAWHSVPTRYVDDLRFHGGLDLLTGSPELHQTDLAVSARDARLDLSWRRSFHRDYAFGSGPYGVGMLDGARLYQAMPVWWRPQDVAAVDGAAPEPADGGTATKSEGTIARDFTGAKVHQRLIFEQPGQFQIQAGLAEDGDRVGVRNDALSQVRRFPDRGPWHLIHRGNVVYKLRSKLRWPEYRDLLGQINEKTRASDETDRLRFPLMRFPGSMQAPGALYGEVQLTERVDYPWKNRMAAEDAARFPTELWDAPNDRGGRRTVDRTWKMNPAGTVIETQTMQTRSVQGTYAYTDDGYLARVELNQTSGGGTPRGYTLTWSEPVAEVGQLKLRRLVKVEALHAGDDDVVFEAQYPENSLAASHLGDGYCLRGLDVTRDGTSGRVVSVALPGCGEVPELGRTFATVGGTRLSSGYTFAGVDATHTFSRTWERRNLEGFRFDPDQGGAAVAMGGSILPIHQWLLTGDGFGDQTFDYDGLGRLTAHQIHGASQRWTYQAAPWWIETPATTTDAVGGTLRYDVTQAFLRVSDATASGEGGTSATHTTFFSTSGVPILTEDLVGRIQGGTASVHYRPSGKDLDADSFSVRTLNLPGSGKAMTERRLNPFGDVTEETHLDVTNRFTYDGLGRLDTATDVTLGRTLNLDYEVVAGQGPRVAVVDQSTEVTTETDYDIWGRVTAQRRTAPDPRNQAYTYDALGRLARTTDTQTGQTETYTYFGTTSLPTRIVTGQGGTSLTTAYNVVQGGEGPVVQGMTVQAEGESYAEHLVTDALGRVAETQMADVGRVRIAYDVFGRAIRVEKLPEDPAKADGSGEGAEPALVITYGKGKITVADGFKDVTTVTRWSDPAGQTVTTTVSGSGVDKARETESITTVAGSPRRLRVVTEEKSEGHTVTTTAEVNGRGAVVKAGSGPIEVTADAFNSAGMPTQMTVASTLGGNQAKRAQAATSVAFTYDRYNRVTGGTNAHGLDWSVDGYDGRWRPTGTTDTRGLSTQRSYDDWQDTLRAVTTTEPNRSGNETLTLFSREREGQAGMSLLTERGTSWLGATTEVTRHIANASAGVDVSRNGKTMRVRRDAETGQVRTVDDFESNRTQVDPENFGRRVRATLPDGAERELELNGFGQPRAFRDSGVTTREWVRDALGRVNEVRTPDRVYDFAYSEESQGLASITGGRHDLNFSNWSPLGQPQTIEIGDVARIEVQYHRGGRPSCATITRKGGLPTQMNYNAHGDLVGLKRGNQPLTEYSYNRWGAVASMTVGNGQPLQVFGSGDSPTVNLPGGVTADVDPEGRLSQVTYPGLATKEYGYDGLGRMTRVTIGGVLLRSYQYGQGRLEQITAGEPGSEEVYVYGYDAEGRLTSLTRDGVAWGSWTYPDLADLRQQEGLADPNRVQRYTDPNGVAMSYGYEDGQVTLIDIAQGPSFQMAYDAGGNQTQIRAMGMEARFSEWVNDMPTRIAWGDGTTFDLSQDDKGQLDSIAESGGVFLLDLDWEDVPREGLCSEAGEAGPPDKKISKVTRKAPGLEETWEPTYTEAQQLQSIQITRTGGQDTDTLTESYGEVRNQLLGGLTRVLNGTVVRDDVFTHDATADHRRVGSVTGTGGVDVTSYDPALGNLGRIDTRDGRVREFAWDGFRRLTEIREDGVILGRYAYDHQNRRIRAATPASDVPLVFAWHGSRVIAIGQQRGTAEAPRIAWTHAIGQGPLGPAFLKDLTGGGNDYYIATDHLGTPYAYKHVASGTVYLSPLTPWGERVQSPSLGAQAGVVPDSVFASAPLGLGGHLVDWETGLTQMHHRYYDPSLGHFLNPDFREPDLYDPTTVKEPYAYAAGNPILFWDPDGLSTKAYFNDVFADKLYTAGLAYGLTKETLFGLKDFSALAYRYNTAKFRVQHSQSLEIWGLEPLNGIEDDIAYIELIDRAIKTLVLEKGIFQTIGVEGGSSLADTVSLTEEKKYLQAGVASTKFVEAITILASLPKAGLSVSRKIPGSVARRLDDYIDDIARQADVSSQRSQWYDLEMGWQRGGGYSEPNTLSSLVHADAVRLLPEGRKHVAVARAASESLLSPAFTNFRGDLRGKYLFPGLEKLGDDFVRVVDEKRFIRAVRELYSESGNPLTLEVENMILNHIRKGYYATRAGVPGLHAEIQALNWILNKGASLKTVSVATYRLVGSADRIGKRFPACVNCTGIFSGKISVVTGVNGTGFGLLPNL
ncbi:Ig-like domain-containing protein [Sulfidibacter corallicola]